MTTTLTVDGTGIRIELEVPEGRAPQLIEIAISEENKEGETATISLSGEGISFEREISVRKTSKLVEVALRDGESELQETDIHRGKLPDDFFRRLTEKQEALIRVLLEADGWMLNEEVRRTMEDEYGLSVDGGRGVAGILAGLSRKWSAEFRRDLIEGNWADEQVEFRLNEEYEEQLRAGFE